LPSLKTVQVFYDLPEAVAAKSMLEAHGIFAVLPDWFHATNAWHYTFALQGIRLCVLEDDEVISTELLTPSPTYEEPKKRASFKTALIACLCFFIANVPYPVRQRSSSR
jgi:hypothetical protein